MKKREFIEQMDRARSQSKFSNLDIQLGFEYGALWAYEYLKEQLQDSAKVQDTTLKALQEEVNSK